MAGSSKCVLCGSNRAKLLYAASDVNRKTPGRFNVRECASCGLVRLDPVPSKAQLTAAYPAEYEEYRLSGKGVSEEEWRSLQRDKFVLVKNFGPAKILDVGCGDGIFLKFCRDAGWQADGVELSESGARDASRRLGKQVVQGDFMETKFPANSFDVITMWHVLEHFRDPLAALEKASRLLRAGGMLVVAVPNIGSVQAKVFGGKWAHLDAPRHIYSFSPGTLPKLAAKAGFEPASSVRFQTKYGAWGIAASLLNLFGARQNVTVAAASNRVLKAAKVAAVAVFSALASAEEALGRGGAMVLFFRKKA